MLPFLIAGPMIRRAEAHKVCVWLATSDDSPLTIKLIEFNDYSVDEQCLQLGLNLYVRIYTITSDKEDFPTDTLIAYDLETLQHISLADYCYEGINYPEFTIPQKLDNIFHGSCRNPHHYSEDTLIAADNFQGDQRMTGKLGAQALILSGDQIYADDVAGPMLLAIHQLIDKLGIFKESKHNLDLPSDLKQQLYQRAEYLPKTAWQNRSKKELGFWLRQDVKHFSSLNCANHLIYFEEFIAMYLLCFSANVWTLVSLKDMEFLEYNLELKQRFNKEKQNITQFSEGLKQCSRLYANISSLMMFDDHDVTDDWNLTASWEQNVYRDPVSRRIIANGLISYWIFQGWGNDAGNASGKFQNLLVESRANSAWDLKNLDKEIFKFSQWDFVLNTQPKIVALDTRTQRWRNESNFNEPSGLLDWEQLCLLEDKLIGEQQVIIVSPAPIFGVKSIEAIQAFFNFIGQPLLVDVENWMAHEGSAKKLLSTFRRSDTPVETIILSGDVHYSFCFSVQSRFGDLDNRIWQLTASGIKNEFPKKLIKTLNVMDSWFYGPKSPLNFFTKRWRMKVTKHDTSHKKGEHLVSHSGISLVSLNNGQLEKYRILHGQGVVTEFSL